MSLKWTYIIIFLPIAISNYCDLQQRSLKLISSHEAGIVEFPSNVLTLSKFHYETDTFDVTENVSGLYIDVLNVLADKCNFTYRLHVKNSSLYEGAGDVIETGFMMH